MSIQVQQLIEGKGKLVCITRDEPVSAALTLMVDFDYSQLPVIKKEGEIDFPEGMVTYEGILRGVRNFGAKLEALRVKDVMISAPTFDEETDLFDVLDKLKETNAVLVTGGEKQGLVGIVTSYDSTQYFRDQTEDLIRVEDIETTIKDFINLSYIDANGIPRTEDLKQSIVAISARPNQNEIDVGKKKEFHELSLGEYISLLVYRKTWDYFEPIFGVPRDSLIELLNKIRIIRNALAHFRGDISPEQRETLKFSADWFSKRMEEFQAKLYREDQEQERIAQLFQKAKTTPVTSTVKEETGEYAINHPTQVSMPEFAISEVGSEGGRYALLADWLQSRPGRIDIVKLSFEEIEDIIGGPLPVSAYEHRAWWANDTQGHPHSKAWLEVGWRTNYLNRTEKQITFVRIHEREKIYIDFFSKLIADLRKRNDFPIRQISPDGTNWIVCQTISSPGFIVAQFVCSFARSNRFRVELYLDTYDQESTKQVFDNIHVQKSAIESVLGELSWERIDDKRASRIAMYHTGTITDNEEKLKALRIWVVENIVKFYKTLEPIASQELLKVLKS